MPFPTTNLTQEKVKLNGHELIRQFLTENERAIDKVLPDGNCLFRALAKQLCGDPEKHIELRKMLINFEVKNSEVFAKLCTSINSTSLVEHVETRRKVFTWGTTVEILATASLFQVNIFEVTESLVPGKVKWTKYSPISCEKLIGLEDASDFGCSKSWLEIVFIGGRHFDSIKPLSKNGKLTRPQLDLKHYEVDLTNL